jgi:hypothetical protein
MRLSLNYFPRQWQRECHASMQRFTVLALHRRAGKTELALMQLIDRALRFDKDMGLFFYCAPFLKQAKAIAWVRLKQRLEPLRRYDQVEISESELSVTFKHNGAVIRIFGADNPDAMRGVRLDGVVLDEVAQIKPEVWQDIVQPALSDRKGWALFIGTPSGVNLFSELFYRAERLPQWYSARYTVYDTQAIDAEEVERLRRDMAETSFAREYLCDFTAAGDDQLMSLADVDQAVHRDLRKEDYDFAPRILGVDPARFGDDRSVIVMRQGLFMAEPQVYRGIDNMELAGRVALSIQELRPDAVFIDAGNGGGVIDRLRQLGHVVIEVNFGGKPIDPCYVNKRTEMWFALRDWIRGGGKIPNDINLRQDLAAPTYKFDPSNRIALEPKDKIKARGLPSPDIGDALALTFAQPVAKRLYGLQTQLHDARTGENEAYDPYANL